METIIVKQKDELLTVAEAAEAQSRVELPANYQFEHWSRSPIEDEMVAELLPSGEGLTIDENKVFYPVISTGSLLGFDLPTREEFDKTGTIGHYGEDFFIGNLLDSRGSSEREDVRAIEGDSNYIHIGLAVSLVTYSYFEYRDYVDFGMISLVNLPLESWFSVTSEFTDIKYYIKVTTGENFGSFKQPITFRFYLKYDDNLHKIADTPDTAVSWFKKGDIVQFGGRLRTFDDEPPIGMRIDYQEVVRTYQALTPWHAVFSDYVGGSDFGATQTGFYAKYTFDPQAGLFNVSEPYNLANAKVGDIFFRGRWEGADPGNPYSSLTQYRVNEVNEYGDVMCAYGYLTAQRS